jgi:peptidoglycan/LPS O-acetylase OafA/YrhL
MRSPDRLHALDAVRAFALLLGIAFHASFSFIPGVTLGIVPAVDVSPSETLSAFAFITHIFRMPLFFFIAGFFARMLLHRDGVRGFWRNRLKRILVPLVVGWAVFFPALVAVWMWGFSRSQDPPPPLPWGFALERGAFPLSYLWFLYYLLLLYAAVLTLRSALSVVDRSGQIVSAADWLIKRSLSGYWAVVLLSVPLATTLYVRPGWLYWGGIPTPDHSLIPRFISFVGFGAALAFGWLVHRQPADLLATMQSRWVGYGVIALAATAACLWQTFTATQHVVPDRGLGKLAYALLYCFAIWGWVIAITGFALRFLSRENAIQRYLADASYWLYLAHLPIVAACQVWVSQWPLPWSLKFLFVLAISLALLFASYHWLVRPTFVGNWLNGNVYRPREQKIL